jgi:hypothetical protein
MSPVFVTYSAADLQWQDPYNIKNRRRQQNTAISSPRGDDDDDDIYLRPASYQ